MISKKKIVTFSILFFILILNIVFFFINSYSEKKKLIQKNHIFQAELEENSKNEINLIIKNDIENLNEKFNCSMPNFTIFLFDINSNSIEWINEVSNIVFLPKFGLKKINKKFLNDAKKLDIKNLYIKISIKNSFQENQEENLIYSRQSDSILNLDDEEKEIFFSTNYFLEENRRILNELIDLKKEYKVNYYIHEEDLAELDNNSELINLIIELKPILISTSGPQSCTSKQNICFFSSNYSIDSILEKITNLKNEIIHNKLQKKNIILGFSADREDVSILDFIKKIKENIYSGKINKN